MTKCTDDNEDPKPTKSSSTTGDSLHYHRFFWEQAAISQGASPWLDDPKQGDIWSGRSLFLNVSLDDANLKSEAGARIHGQDVWGTRGIAVNKMSDLVPFMYSGELFDDNVGVLRPLKETDLDAVSAFVQDPSYSAEVRKIDQTFKVTAATLAKVPFDIPHWRRVATEKYPKGLPKPFSNNPTQWLFDGHPRGSADPNVAREGAANPRLVMPQGVRPGMAEHPLQVGVARLVGYRWPRQTGSSFMDCPAISEQDEADRSDLVAADGIVSLAALDGKADAATRLRELIRVVWGPDYREGTIRDLLAVEDAGAGDLATWLADEFFDGHCKLFHQTPFIWHVWDGVRGGFSALVNYHRLCDGNGAGRRVLEKLRDTYLVGEWIPAQRRALTSGEAGAEERLVAAEHLRGELTKIIDGEPPCDIFVRWKALHRQPIGWEPDIDDGVRLNIRPFLTAKPRNPGRRDACILRVTPRVKKHDGVDRGAEPRRELKRRLLLQVALVLHRRPGGVAGARALVTLVPNRRKQLGGVRQRGRLRQRRRRRHPIFQVTIAPVRQIGLPPEIRNALAMDADCALAFAKLDLGSRARSAIALRLVGRQITGVDLFSHLVTPLWHENEEIRTRAGAQNDQRSCECVEANGGSA